MFRRMLILGFLFVFIRSANAQTDMKSLVKIYNSSSLAKAFSSLNNIGGFRGVIIRNVQREDSAINGTIGSDTIEVRWIRDKANIWMRFTDSLYFTGLKEQADNQLYAINDYTRVHYGVSTRILSYSDKPNMKIGDLSFLLSIVKVQRELHFYSVTLFTYPEN